MHIHEYQAKAIFARYGIPVQRGVVVASLEEISAALDKVEPPFVVKAQVHAGGRGKGGGVKFASTKADAQAKASDLLGRHLVTPQTDCEGQPIKKVYIVEACDIEAELYLSCTLDRTRACLTFVASAAGGVEIEDVAHKDASAIIRISMDPTYGVRPFHGMEMSNRLGLGSHVGAIQKLLEVLTKMMWDLDADLIEINPLVIAQSERCDMKAGNPAFDLGDGRIFLALDAKMSFDDNALWRQLDVQKLFDPSQEKSRDVEARADGLNYIQLDGDIGCMVNGAGLAMATMDIIHLCGGKAANFLDVGGDTTQDRVAAAFRILAQDPDVKVIFVNILGGIVHCDIIAQGIVAAAKACSFKQPLVARLEGTNVDAGRKILKDAPFHVYPLVGFEEAVRQAVKLARDIGGQG
jgi:succinyl-CoA synthetase beta subunit